MKRKKWTSDNIVEAYLKFLSNKKFLTVKVRYYHEDAGYKEAMEGVLNFSRKEVEDLPSKIRRPSKHELEIRAGWEAGMNQEMVLTVNKEDGKEICEVMCHDSLKKEVSDYFKNFNPKILEDDGGR